MTGREIKEALDRAGVFPSKQLGQNFLTDPNMARWIVSQLDAGEDDAVVEVGPGTGSLSEQAVDALFTDGPGGPPPATDSFRITDVTRAADGSVTITWPSTAGEQFTVHWSTTLATGAWTGVGGTLTATGPTTSFTLPAGGTPDPATAPAGYLRVRRL